MIRPRLVHAIVLCSSVATVRGSAVAQTPTAAVTGLIRDSSSVPLADAEVRATDRGTGFAYRTSSSKTGRYWLRGLPPGLYDLTVERVGFRATTARGVGLHVARTADVDFTLDRSPFELAPLVVSVDQARVESTHSGVSYVLDHRRIEELPEESRQFTELAQLLPGASRGIDAAGAPPQFGTSGSSVGALSRQSLGVLVDGADFTEGLFGDLAGSLPMLAVREFEVVQGQYSADLGRAASGLINVVTRSGENEFRAEGFALYRNRALNARGAFESEKPDFNRWHWGVAAGGPIVRDRTQVFAAFERREQNDFSTVETGGAFPEYEGTFRTPFEDNLIFARLDHRVSDAHELTLRYAGEIGQQLIGVGGIRSLEYGQQNKLQAHSVLLTHRWSPAGSWLNEARLHVMSQRREQLRNAPDGPTLAYPDLIAGPNEAEERSRSVRVELRNELSSVIGEPYGSHRLRFGTQLSWLHTETESAFFENGFFTFPDDSAALPTSGQVSFRDPAVHLDANNLQVSLYAQDDWSPTSRLTLELGLRYDLETNGSDQGYVSPFAGQLPFIPDTPRPIDWDNLAPRLGVTWDASGDGRTMVRAGFGVFYDALVAGPLLALERSSGVPFAVLRDPGTTDVDALMIDPDTVPPIVWTAGNIETPMTRQASLGIEHVFPRGFVFRVDGLFIQGRHLLLRRNLNPYDENGFRFPSFSRVAQLLSEGRATAEMLLASLRKDFANGWLDVGYTLAGRRNTNDTWGQPLVPQTGLDGVDLSQEWGPAAWDEHHRLVAMGDLALPMGLEVVAKTIYASSRPYTAWTGRDDNGDLGGENDRPAGERRNARRGPDFLRTDIGFTWTGPEWRSARPSIVINVYNVFNRTNATPESVQNDLGSPIFGRATAAFPPRQVEVGIRVSGG